MSTSGDVLDAVARMTGLASEVKQSAGALDASLRMLLEQAQALDDALGGQAVRLVFQRDYPVIVYVSPDEWQMVRRALRDGALVLVKVGHNEHALKTVRIVDLEGTSGTPNNAHVLPYDALDNVTPDLLCPNYGATPNKAVWSIAIFGTRELGA